MTANNKIFIHNYKEKKPGRTCTHWGRWQSIEHGQRNTAEGLLLFGTKKKSDRPRTQRDQVARPRVPVTRWV